MERSAHSSQLGRALGLRSYKPFNVYDRRASFRELERARGKRDPIDAEPSPWEMRWFSGEVDGRECMIVPHTDVSGLGVEQRSAIVVRVDPPLHLGTWITKTDGWQWGKVSDVHLNDGYADALVRIQAFEPRALTTMLRSETRDDHGRTLRDAIVSAVEDGAEITDSSVTYHLPGNHHSMRDVRYALSRGARLADALTAQRATIPELEFERSYRSRWAASAAARGLEFDPRALLVHGKLDRVTVEVAVDVTPVKSHVTVTSRWPERLRDSTGAPLGMYVVPTRQLGKLDRWFGQDIRVGAKPFDDVFAVRGELDAEIERAFADADLRDALVSVGTAASEMMLNDRGAFWQLEGDAARADAIEAQLETVEHLSAALLGRARDHGPYR